MRLPRETLRLTAGLQYVESKVLSWFLGVASQEDAQGNVHGMEADTSESDPSRKSHKRGSAGSLHSLMPSAKCVYRDKLGTLAVSSLSPVVDDLPHRAISGME